MTQLPVYVAKAKGLFAKNGLDVHLRYIAGGATLTAAMLSGQVPIATVGEDGLISADVNGADLVMLAAGPTRLLFSVYSKSGIGSVADLKGKRLGISKVGGATDFAARWLLNAHHLAPDKDVTLVQIGGVPQILAALQSGAIDAGVMSPPTMFDAQRQGLKLLVDLSKQDLPFYQSPIAAPKPWLHDHRDIAVRYVRAFNQAVELIHTDPQTAAAVLGTYTKLKDKDVLTKSVAALSAVLPLDQVPKVAGVKVGISGAALRNPKAENANPATFLDVSVEQEASKPA